MDSMKAASYPLKTTLSKSQSEPHPASKDKKMNKNFITPPNHVNFKAKKLFENAGEIIDGAIAYMTLNGGDPVKQHTHAHNRLFIVTKGEAKILPGDQKIIIHQDEAFLVKGSIPHSVWNNHDEETVIIGISFMESDR